MKNKQKEVVLPWGMQNILEKIPMGSLTVLAGYMCSGREAFSMMLAEENAENYCSVLYVSLWKNKEAFLNQIVSRYTGVPTKQIEEEDMHESEKELVELALEDIKEWDLNILDSKDFFDNDIKKHIKELSPQLLIISYLEFFFWYQQDVTTLKKLKQLAKELNITIFVLTSVRNKDGYEISPNVSDLPKNIMDNSDIVFFTNSGLRSMYDFKKHEGEVPIEITMVKNDFNKTEPKQRTIECTWFHSRYVILEKQPDDENDTTRELEKTISDKIEAGRAAACHTTKKKEE